MIVRKPPIELNKKVAKLVRKPPVNIEKKWRKPPLQQFPKIFV